MDSNKPTFDEVIACVANELGIREPITGEMELQKDLGVDGDDMYDALEAYSERFGVNMETILWYFHTCGEGWSIGRVFFKPPRERVVTIPITVHMLHECALKGRWDIEYPPHSVPERRYDIWIDQFVFGAPLAFVLLLILYSKITEWFQ